MLLGEPNKVLFIRATLKTVECPKQVRTEDRDNNGHKWQCMGRGESGLRHGWEAIGKNSGPDWARGTQTLHFWAGNQDIWADSEPR